MRGVACLVATTSAVTLAIAACLGTEAAAATKSTSATIAPCGKMPCALKHLKTKTREPLQPRPKPWLKQNNPGPPERR
jgi:hypothetical protein